MLPGARWPQRLSARILFDQGTPAPLRRELAEHDVNTAYEKGWSTLENGELLSAVETDGYDLLLTTDLNLRYQQNLADRGIAIVVLSTTSWPRIRKAVDRVLSAVSSAERVSYSEVTIP